jgi:sulfatase modifying factor 1
MDKLGLLTCRGFARSVVCIFVALASRGSAGVERVYPAVPSSGHDVVISAGGLDGVRGGMQVDLREGLVDSAGEAGFQRTVAQGRVIEVRDHESVARLPHEGSPRKLPAALEARFQHSLTLSGKVVIAMPDLPDMVWVDGASRADSVSFYLTAGRHKVRVVKIGHEPWGAQVEVSPGETVEVCPKFPDLPRERVLVRIPGGTFMRGSPRGARDERPIRSVTLDPFYIRACEVSCAEYWEFDASHRMRTRGGASHPADNLNWWDGAQFCNWLSRKEGLRPFYDEQGLKARAETLAVDWSADGYRLPTEAEWEFACRAGTETAYYWGDTPDGRYMWYSANAEGSTHPTGTRLPNSFGLWDMSGNVAEWCNDWYNASYYGSSKELAPRGPVVGSHRVIRGGSWSFHARGCRSAERFFLRPRDKFEDLGFRPVRPAPD